MTTTVAELIAALSCHAPGARVYIQLGGQRLGVLSVDRMGARTVLLDLAPPTTCSEPAPATTPARLLTDMLTGTAIILDRPQNTVAAYLAAVKRRHKGRRYETHRLDPHRTRIERTS